MLLGFFSILPSSVVSSFNGNAGIAKGIWGTATAALITASLVAGANMLAKEKGVKAVGLTYSGVYFVDALFQLPKLLLPFGTATASQYTMPRTGVFILPQVRT